MNVLFFGTSEFAADILASLLRYGVKVVAVVTKIDKPRGRSLRLTPSPVKKFVLENYPHLPILQPQKASTPEFLVELAPFSPDLFVVAAYGEIIRSLLLDFPPLGCINVHGSILPKYRGAAPMHRCLMNGEKETGVTIINMVLEMDAGDILATATMEIPPEMNVGELEKRLSALAISPLMQVLGEIQTGSLRPLPQIVSQVTFANKIQPHETEIRWNQSAEGVWNQIRALTPEPGAWCWVEVASGKKRMRVTKAEVVSTHHATDASDWIIPCNGSKLRLLEVQLEGKQNLPVAQFLRGLHGICKIL